MADPAAAIAGPTSPAQPGIYLSSPWVAPGSEIEVIFVGDPDTRCFSTDSAMFVDAHGSTEFVEDGFGDTAWSTVNNLLVPLDVGTAGPVAGHLDVTCEPYGGGATTTVSLPLIVSATQPSTIYHSSTMWSYYSPSGITTEGDEVTVNALGFEPGESVTVSFVNSTMSEVSWDLTGAISTPVAVTADGEGAIAAQVIVPSGWTNTDVVDVVVAGSSSRYLMWSSPNDPFEGDPSLEISGTVSAFPGGAVTVSAGGFVAGETVVVALHSASARAVPLGTMTANGAGRISGSVYLPAGIAPANYRVWAGAKVISYLLLNTPLSVGLAPATSRVAGADRFETAVAMSQSVAPFAAGTGTVYLTSGMAFPDALGAGALAAQIGAPVLLTSPGSMPSAVRAELERLHPVHVKVVGGLSAVSAALFADVEGMSFTHDTVRLGGTDRYDTNRLLINDALNHATTVYLAAGSNFPDAVAAGPAAASVGGAVVLVNGSAATLDQPTLDLLTSLGVTHVRIAGGTAAVSPGIQSQLNTLYPGNVVRFAGTDRYDTASQIVGGAWPGTVPRVILASGANFPDALAAGALGLPMLTSQQGCIPAVVLAQLGALQPTTITFVGGTAALGDNIASFAHCG